MHNKLQACQLLKYISISTVIRLISVFAVSLFTANAFADAVHDMCTDRSNTDKVCACAASQLKTEVGDKDYALYQTIGAAWLSKQSNGMGHIEAWDAAIKAESDRRGVSTTDTLSKTNKIGRAYGKAIKTCKN